jgi:hypothetical protein
MESSLLRFNGDLAYQTARRPFSIPATLKSSSTSGQWMPIAMIS